MRRPVTVPTFVIGLLGLIAGLGLCTRAYADVLVLASGARVSGTTVGVSRGTVTFKDARGVTRRYRPDEVRAIEFSPADIRRTSTTILTVVPQMKLSVRLLEVIDSSIAAATQRYVGVLEADVRAGSQVLVPQGSTTQIAIREAGVSDAAGRPSISLEIVSMGVRGRLYRLSEPSDDGSPDGQGTPVKKPVFAADFSDAEPAAPAFRIVPGGPPGSLRATLTSGMAPEIEPLANAHLRIRAGAHLVFSTQNLVTLQAAR